MLTVHGAKGLEWDVVAVAGLVTDGFPDQAKSHDWASTPAAPSPLRGDRDQLPILDLTAAATGAMPSSGCSSIGSGCASGTG